MVSERLYRRALPFAISLVTASAAMSFAVAPLSIFSSSLLAADEALEGEQEAKGEVRQMKTKEELLSQENIKKISQAYGHFVARSLDNPLLKLDFDAVIQGMTDAKNGTQSPMTEQEYEEAITQIQELAFQESAAKNLKEAEDFLSENAKKTGVQELEPGKLQILIEKEGNGEVVTESVMPVIHYTGSYINGTVFGSSVESKEPISLSLNQTIPGFKKGVLGMKVGEKRRIFIHPDLGYGTSGQLMPNALLVFDVEVVRVEPLPKEEAVDAIEEVDEEVNDDISEADDEVEGLNDESPDDIDDGSDAST